MSDQTYDKHTRLAAILFEVPESEVTAAQRANVKAIAFASDFGMGGRSDVQMPVNIARRGTEAALTVVAARLQNMATELKRRGLRKGTDAADALLAMRLDVLEDIKALDLQGIPACTADDIEAIARSAEFKDNGTTVRAELMKQLSRIIGCIERSGYAVVRTRPW